MYTVYNYTGGYIYVRTCSYLFTHSYTYACDCTTHGIKVHSQLTSYIMAKSISIRAVAAIYERICVRSIAALGQ